MYVSPQKALERIEPGMSIFIGTGVGEPATLVRQLIESDADNLQDLELVQLVSLGDTIDPGDSKTRKYRLKTFFSGWVASDAITQGRVDLIPSRFSGIPDLILRGLIAIDAAFVQVTPPDESGYCSLGVAVDVARQAIEKASYVVAEVNDQVPRTYGDTFVHVSEFDAMVESKDRMLTFPRWTVDDVFDRLGENVASVIEDGDCIGFTIGPLFEALGQHLQKKKNLGVHSPFFTDALMDLVSSGAVTNRNKATFRGKSVTCYALGSAELMKWLDRNPLVEFQGIDKVFSPLEIGKNPCFVSVFPARKVDLSGRIALHYGRGNVYAGPGEAADFFNGAEISRGGKNIFALPSRNLKREANIRISVEEFPNLFIHRESIDMVVTEYGVAGLRGRSVRERAQELIDIAHPDDRLNLVNEAKDRNIIYRDQLFIEESARLYPSGIQSEHVFKNQKKIRFRAIKPSDEEGMRRLFYRFSDKAVYYRYFSPVKTMPHCRMQEYVNVDYARTLSIVGLEGPRLIAEARYSLPVEGNYADIAFVVDEEYQGLGIASYMYGLLVQHAKERGIGGFTADVLASNKGMMKVFEKGDLPVNARLDSGIYELSIPFGETAPPHGPRIRYEHMK